MTRTIVIVSGKGGVGKTTTAINLSSALHKFGKNVLLVDGSLSTPDIGLYLGSPMAPVNFHTVLSGKASPSEAVYLHSSGLKILPGSISFKDMYSADPKRMANAIENLKKYTDYLIIDSSAGFSKDTINAMHSSSEMLIITNPDLPSVTNALKISKLAENMDKKITGVVLTRKKNSSHEMSEESVSNMLDSELLTIIPEDENVKLATSEKDILLNLYPNTKASKAYMNLAAKLIGVEYKSETTFMENLMKVLRVVKK